MAYYTQEQLSQLGFKSFGENVKISDRASIYDCNQIEIGDNSRIDDFCVISGNLKIGRNVHITPLCLVAGGVPGVIIEDFSTLAYGVKVFSQSDDYSGNSMVNSTIPNSLKKEIKKAVLIERQSIIGAGSIVMPGVTIAIGTSVGANSLVLKSTNPWEICAGSPAKKIKDRKQELLALEREYLNNE
ncbi:MAG: acyltransferase [Candidatus Brocadiales bacterium]|nr:acyltransferase [Candidatus Brocadiales bacterium]